MSVVLVVVAFTIQHALVGLDGWSAAPVQIQECITRHEVKA